MAAQKAMQRKRYTDAFFHPVCRRDIRFSGQPPGAAGQKMPFDIRINIQKDMSLKHRKISGFCPKQPDLFIGRNHNLKLRMHKRIIV